MLVYQRVYELSKCHCWILLIGYWLGGYFAWFIRDEFCCNLRRHSWDTYEPTNTMGWDRADRARTTGHDLAMKRNMSNPDWNRIPAGHERGATHYAACARSLKIEKKHGWTVDQWPLFIFVHLCSTIVVNNTVLMLIRQSTGTPWSLHPVSRYCASLTPGNGRWRLRHGLRGTSHLIRGSSSASRRWMVSWICLMTSENGIWTIQYLPSGKLT